MQALADHIFAILRQYGYAAILLGVMLDNAGFPIPGEIILLLSGSLVVDGHFVYVAAVFAGAMGALASDSVWYWIGRRGSERLIKLYCQVSFGSSACIARTGRMLHRFGPSALIYARFVPGFRTFAAPMASMAGITYPQFLLYNGIGSLLWACTGVAVGILFAHRIIGLLDGIEHSKTPMLYLAAAFLLLFFLLKWLARRRHGAATPGGMQNPS